MKHLLFLSCIFFFSLFLSAQTAERICMEKVFGTDTVWVYSSPPRKEKCNTPTRIVLAHDNRHYIVWQNSDSVFIEPQSTIVDMHYDVFNKKLSVLFFYKKKYMPDWTVFACKNQEDTLIWMPNRYKLPIRATDIAYEDTYLVNTDIVAAYYRSLPQPIIYIINKKGELLEYRDGKVVDENTLPYRTPFKPHNPEPPQQDLIPPSKH